MRVRRRVLPVLEAELGPGIAEALARTAEQLREDSDALDAMVEETIEEICEPAEAGIAVSVGALGGEPGRAAAAHHPPRRRQRVRRHASAARRPSRSRGLVTDWHGQKALDLPGVRVKRDGGLLVFTAASTPSDHTPITQIAP